VFFGEGVKSMHDSLGFGLVGKSVTQVGESLFVIRMCSSQNAPPKAPPVAFLLLLAELRILGLVNNTNGQKLKADSTLRSFSIIQGAGSSCLLVTCCGGCCRVTCVYYSETQGILLEKNLEKIFDLLKSTI
jgi:hypothetical protein